MILILSTKMINSHRKLDDPSWKRLLKKSNGFKRNNVLLKNLNRKNLYLKKLCLTKKNYLILFWINFWKIFSMMKFTDHIFNHKNNSYLG